MRFMQILEIPNAGFQRVYRDREALVNARYETQVVNLFLSGLGEDFLFVPFLDAKQHETMVVFPNCEHSQIQWGTEQRCQPNWNVLDEILQAQIARWMPDVLLTVAGQRTGPALLAKCAGFRPKLAVHWLTESAEVAPDLSQFDLVLATSEALSADAQAAGAKQVELMPPAVNHRLWTETAATPRLADIAFVGDWPDQMSGYTEVLETVGRLGRDEGWNLALHCGETTADSVPDSLTFAVRSPVELNAEAHVYRGAAMTLCLPRSGRDFMVESKWKKAALLGSVVVAPAGCGIERVLPPDEGCVVFDGVDDLEDRLRRLKANHRVRSQIAIRGRNIIREQHSLKSRAVQFDQIVARLLGK